MQTHARSLRAVAGFIFAAALATLFTFFSAPPAASSSGPCPDNTGVNVVIDFQSLGGATIIACDPNGAGKTALNVFKSAATITGTGAYRDSVICRVNNKPGSDTETCDTMPPGDAYWSIWTARAGSWGYNTHGATNTIAKAGEWHGLSFAKDSTPSTVPAPRVNPTVPPAPKPDPTPSKTSSPKPKPTKTATPKPSKTSKPKSSGSATSASKPSSSTKPEESATSDAQPEKTSDTSTPDDEDTTDNGTEVTEGDDATPEAADSPPDTTDDPTQVEKQDQLANRRAAQEEGGPPVGTLIVIGAIVLIAAAALTRQRLVHRSREEN